MKNLQSFTEFINESSGGKKITAILTDGSRYDYTDGDIQDMIDDFAHMYSSDNLIKWIHASGIWKQGSFQYTQYGKIKELIIDILRKVLMAKTDVIIDFQKRGIYLKDGSKLV